MQFSQGANPVRSKATNHSSILRMIYYYGPLKRSDIAGMLGLTLPTITACVNKMIAAGIVHEVDGAVSGYLGRKAHLIDINADARYFLGVEMRGIRRAVCITDYRGSVLYQLEDETPYEDYNQNIQAACGMILETVEKGGLKLDQIARIGFCTPGLVDRESGYLGIHPGYNWANKNLRGDIAALTGYRGPIEVENNSCARATAAQMFQRDLLNNVPTFAYLFVASGIACPFVLNTSISMGSIVGAGEIGHMVMNPSGPLCVCGNHGCLEAYSGDHVIISACRELITSGTSSFLKKLCPSGSGLTMEMILEAQNQGDTKVREIIQGAIFMLGLAIANIINFSGPQKMLIEGKLFQNPQNRTDLLDIVSQNLYNKIHTDTEFHFMDASSLSGAIGAAAVAISSDLESFTE